MVRRTKSSTSKPSVCFGGYGAGAVSLARRSIPPCPSGSLRLAPILLGQACDHVFNLIAQTGDDAQVVADAPLLDDAVVFQVAERDAGAPDLPVGRRPIAGEAGVSADGSVAVGSVEAVAIVPRPHHIIEEVLVDRVGGQRVDGIDHHRLTPIDRAIGHVHDAVVQVVIVDQPDVLVAPDPVRHAHDPIDDVHKCFARTPPAAGGAPAPAPTACRCRFPGRRSPATGDSSHFPCCLPQRPEPPHGLLSFVPSFTPFRSR